MPDKSPGPPAPPAPQPPPSAPLDLPPERGAVFTPPEQARPHPQSRSERFLAVVREVLVTGPIPHSLHDAYKEIERRVREG